jgi:hypothetical protein
MSELDTSSTNKQCVRIAYATTRTDEMGWREIKHACSLSASIVMQIAEASSVTAASELGDAL